MDEEFHRPVRSGGYSWWYFDALSDDGERAFTAIFFRGSVFSPDYARRTRGGERPSADDHLCVNLALYHRGKQVAWVMSEYGASSLRHADERQLAIENSSIILEANRLQLSIHDRSAPFMASLAKLGVPVHGAVELQPVAPPLDGATLVGSDGERHHWRALQPRARVKVRFRRPQFCFDGWGYHDINRGDARLEAAFARWSWARFHPREDEQRTVVLYSVQDRDGRVRALSVDSAQSLAPHAIDHAVDGPLRPAAWGLRLPEWFAVGERLRCAPDQLLEAAPFYARYTGALTDGETRLGRGVGEYLDLDRFRSRGIQFLLRWKMRKVS